MSLLAYFVECYLAYSVLQLLAFPAYPTKNPPPTQISPISIVLPLHPELFIFLCTSLLASQIQPEYLRFNGRPSRLLLLVFIV